MALPNTTTTRLGSPGDIVVPFSEIAALLQTRLSSLELDSLLGQLLGSRSSLIQPGDLITADWASDVVTRIAALERGDAGTIGGALNARAVQTLFQTFDAYGKLLARGSFLPDGTGADAVAAALRITTAFQSVAILAAASTATAAAASIAVLVGIFARLYDAQKALAVLLAATLPGYSKPQPRVLYAQLLTANLDNDAAGGGALSLRSAVARNDAAASIAAQDRINGISMSEAGDVVSGSIEVTYRGSTRGETLVPDDGQPFGYLFRVSNKTDRTLDFQLAAEFLRPKSAWNSYVTVAGGAARILTLRPFNPNNPTDPAATQEVQVNVRMTTPPNQTIGHKGTLRFTASVPAPINVGDYDEVTLTIGNAATNPQPSRVRFSAGSPVPVDGDISALSSAGVAELRFDFAYSTATAATRRDFRIRVETTGTAAAMQSFFIAFADADVPIDTSNQVATRVQSRSFPLNDGAGRSVTLQLGVNTAASGATLQLTTTVEAIDDPTVFDSRSFTIQAE